MLSSILGFAQPAGVQISNEVARTDVNGDTIDVHDGRVAQFGDTYYWYGTAYGNTSGFTRSNEYRVYSSPDMAAWTPHGAILPDAASGVYYRPHVIYHPPSGKYVLWYNWYPKLWDGRFGVATSASPTGPFEVLNPDVEVKHSALGVGDFGLFVDDDGVAYLMYNTITGHRLSVERLTADYTASTMVNGGFIADGCEAGSVFKRDSTYYLLTDYTCCFCTQGSGARVYTSRTPLSGYALRQNINREPGTFAPALTDQDTSPTHYVSLRRDSATGTFPAIEVWLPEDVAVAQVAVLQFTGDRAGTCGDTIRSYTHDPRVPIGFGVSLHVDGDWTPSQPAAEETRRYALHNALSVGLAPRPADAVRVQLDPAYPYETVQLIEVEITDTTGRRYATATGARAYVMDLDPQLTPPIIPGQQTYVMPRTTPSGETEYVWMSDLWGSAPDNVKGHDLQYWSPPMEFYPNGLIRPLRYQPAWTLH